MATRPNVVWQWWAPDLWRRFTLALRRAIAAKLGVPATKLGDYATVQYAKVAEFQGRAVVHFHALVRLDGPRTDDGFGSGTRGQAGEVACVRERPSLASWCVELLRARRVRLVRGGLDFEWVKSHTYRKTVATLLDQSGASARMIADQPGHSRVSMTHDVSLGRRAGNAANLAALEAFNPDLVPSQGQE